MSNRNVNDATFGVCQMVPINSRNLDLYIFLICMGDIFVHQYQMEDYNTPYDFSPTSIPSPNLSFGLCSSFGSELKSSLQLLVISPRETVSHL